MSERDDKAQKTIRKGIAGLIGWCATYVLFPPVGLVLGGVAAGVAAKAMYDGSKKLARYNEAERMAWKETENQDYMITMEAVRKAHEALDREYKAINPICIWCESKNSDKKWEVCDDGDMICSSCMDKAIAEYPAKLEEERIRREEERIRRANAALKEWNQKQIAK
jgi:hypothetical protein